MRRRKVFGGNGIIWAGIALLFTLAAHDAFAGEYDEADVSGVTAEWSGYAADAYGKPPLRKPIVTKPPKWPGSVYGGGSGPTVAEKTKYTCSNGSVEVANETACGDRAHCEDLCQHSGGSGGNCASSEYFCSVAQP